MNEDRIKGTATDLSGKAKDAFGGLTGDSKTQAEGKFDQISGQVQDAYGQARDAVAEYTGSLGTDIDDLIKERPLVSLLAVAGIGFVLGQLTASRR